MVATKYIYLIVLAIGLIAGYFLCDWINKDSVEVRTVTDIKTDTVFISSIDTVFLTKTQIKHEYIRDTILVEPFKPIINRFNATFPIQYGNAFFEGEVLGEVLKSSFRTELNIPTVTNTVTNTKTVIKKPSGVFLTAGVNYEYTRAYFGVIFVKDRFLFGANTSGFQAGYKVSLR